MKCRAGLTASEVVIFQSTCLEALALSLQDVEAGLQTKCSMDGACAMSGSQIGTEVPDPPSAEVACYECDCNDDLVAHEANLTYREEVEDVDDVEDAEDGEDAEDYEDGEEVEDDTDCTQAFGAALPSPGGSSADAGTGHLSMISRWRPLNLRVLSLHILLKCVSLELPLDIHECSRSAESSEGQRLLLEVRNLHLTLEGLTKLPRAERRCLERLGLLQASIGSEDTVEGPGLPGFSGSCVLTLCSLELAFLNSAKHSFIQVQPLQAASWVITLKLDAIRLPTAVGSCASGAVRASVCVHGLQFFPQPAALEAFGSVLTTLKEAADAYEAVSPSPSKTNSMLSHEQGLTLSADVALCNTLVDLTLLAPLPLRPFRLILPRLEIASAATGCGFLECPPQPTIPSWHTIPMTGEGPDPDWHVYGCLCECGRRDEAESTCLASWELLVTERQWFENGGRAPALERSLLRQDELLRLSASKLRALEHMQRQDKVAEQQHAQSAFTIEKEREKRFPKVLEIFEEKAPEAFEAELQAELEALRQELRALDQLRREEEAALRKQEREASHSLAKARCGSCGAPGSPSASREQELRQRLEEERKVSATLRQLVASQDAVIQQLVG